MARRLLGKEVNADLNERVRSRADGLKAQGIEPKLAILRVGEREDDLAYERGAVKRCETLHVAVEKTLLPEDCTQEDLLQAIDDLNRDPHVHGVLMFRPLPGHLDEKEAIEKLASEKDVDGIKAESMAGVFMNSGVGYPPCTAQAVIEILDHYGIDCTGKKTTVIGRSLVIGKPVAMMLLQKNATVTICHTRTRDLPAEARKAELLIVAAGKAGVVGADCVVPGQTVIDVGIHVGKDGKMCGDVDFAVVEPIVEAITPVPGGVGGVTTSVLISHVVDAAEKSICRK